MQQLGPEFVLERTNRAADPRLGHVQPRRSPEPSRLGDGNERTQLCLGHRLDAGSTLDTERIEPYGHR